MKKQLLTISAMILACSSAMAEGWNKPEYSGAFQALSTTDTVYIYNTESKMFLTEGNDWGTHATVGTEGLQYAVKKHLQTDGSWDNKTYVIRDYTLAKKGWKNVFITDGGNIYMDASDKAADTLFVFKDLGNNKYQIAGGDANPTYNSANDNEGYIVGHYTKYYDAKNDVQTGTGVIFSFFGEDDSFEDGEFNTTWAFVSKEDYQAYLGKAAAYNASLILDATIKEATSFGIEASEALAVYNNTNSTAEELNAADSALKSKILAYYETSVTPTTPKDVTSMVANAECNAIDGWTNDINASTWNTQNWIDGSWTGFEGTTLNIWSGSLKGKAYQTINGLPNGIYVTSIAAYSEKMDGYVFANDNKKSVAGAAAGAKYDITTEVTDGTLSIGYGQDKEGTNWVALDNVQVMYYGSGVEAYRFWLNGLLESAPSFDDSNIIVSKGLVKEYNDVLASVNTVQTKDEILAIIPTYEECLNKINLNIAAYTALKNLQDNCYSLTENEYINAYYKTGIEEYLSDNVEPVIEAHTLGTSDITTETTKVQAMYDEAQGYIWNKEKLVSEIAKMDSTVNEATSPLNQEGEAAYLEFKEEYAKIDFGTMTNAGILEILQTVYDIEFLLTKPADPASDTNPVDYTAKINFPSFNNGAEGWTNEGFGTCGLNTWNSFADGEVIDKSYLNLWDEKSATVKQTISGIPAGAYTVQFSAFADAAGFELFANDNTIDVIVGKNEDGVASIYHNNLSEENKEAFTSESGTSVYYGNIYKIDVVVDETGTLTIGARIANNSKIWAMIDNIKLTYYGTESQIVTGVETIDAKSSSEVIATYNISGVRTSASQKGINIIKMSDGSVKKVIR